MKIKKAYQFFMLVFISFMFNKCVEPFEPQTITFESALVIDATITNELKQQEIFLNRTFEFEQDGPSAESNANVKIVDDMGNEIVFQETDPGIYVSSVAFAAAVNRNYQLSITTNDGRSYSSNTALLPQATQIDDLHAERIINDDGTEGMVILVNSFDPTNTSKNYRYEYEETFKIIAPKWSPNDLAVVPPGDGVPACAVEVVRRQNDEQICYSTVASTDIILTDTNDFSEDRVEGFPVRFINRNNYIISSRYSILVRQLVQSSEVYTFFETLKDFSGSESLFSETQPGFLGGNVFSDNDSNEKVLGYFDVASVSEQRIFFNYSDFFPGEALPPYIEPCVEGAPPLANPGGCILSALVAANLVRLVASNDSPGLGEGPFLVVPRVCGDCTAIGELEVPEFWVEE